MGCITACIEAFRVVLGRTESIWLVLLCLYLSLKMYFGWVGCQLFFLLEDRQDVMWNGDWFPVVCEDGCPDHSTQKQAYEFRTRKLHERQAEDWQARVSQWRSILIDRVKFCVEDRLGEASLACGKF